MPENVQVDTSTTQSSGSSSAPGSSSEQSTQTSGEKSPAKDTIVKSLVERANERTAKRFGKEAANSTEGKAATSAADRSESSDTSSSQKKTTGNAEPANTDKDSKEKGSPEKKVDSSGKATTEEGDPALAKRIAALATQEQNIRVANDRLKTERENFDKERTSHKELTDNVTRFVQTFGKDPEEALKFLGLQDDHIKGLYWRLNDKYLNGKEKSLTIKDVEERAKEIADQRFKELQESGNTERQTNFNAAMEAAKAQYVTNTAQFFMANKAKFPAVAALGIPAGDVHKYCEDTYRATQKMPTYEETLAHFEGTLGKKIEASGYTRPKIDAPKANEKPVSSKTVTADWQSKTTPSEKKEEPKTLKESREQIKKKLDQGLFKRQRA